MPIVCKKQRRKGRDTSELRNCHSPEFKNAVDEAVKQQQKQGKP
jgi:hypothetical protein